jgi:hypothetical protein
LTTEAGQRHAVLAEALDEVRRLAQRVGLRRRDDDEGRPVGLEQPESLLRRARGSRRTACDGPDERLHVAEERGAEHLGEARPVMMLNPAVIKRAARGPG